MRVGHQLTWRAEGSDQVGHGVDGTEQTSPGHQAQPGIDEPFQLAD